MVMSSKYENREDPGIYFTHQSIFNLTFISLMCNDMIYRGFLYIAMLSCFQESIVVSIVSC